MTATDSERRMAIWIPRLIFLYLSEPDMIKAGVKDMKSCVDVMEDLLITLYKGDYVREVLIIIPMAA